MQIPTSDARRSVHHRAVVGPPTYPDHADLLASHPKVHLHFTPTYSSWLNQVELWLGKIERDVIARGVFTSVGDLKRKLMRYIRQYNKAPRTVKWKYADPRRHISTGSVVTGH
jgi:transposase